MPDVLSSHTLEELAKHGFTIVRGLLTPEWIEHLHTISSTWIESLDRARLSGEPLKEHGVITRQEKEYLYSVERLHNKGRIESLELLGHPAIRSLVRQTIGDEALATFEGFFINRQGDGLRQHWHQGPIRDRAEPAINVTIALDDLDDTSAAPRILPGSHLEPQDVCKLRDERGDSPEGLALIALHAGDALVCDPMIASNSVRMQSDRTVRTVQYWFRTDALATNEGFSDGWIAVRRPLLPLADFVYSRLHEGKSERESFADTAARESLYETTFPDLHGLYAVKAIYPSGNFCLDFKTGDVIKTE